jgi:hypothetical protein
MPISLSIDDFRLSKAVCELRYENSYLVFDRTGQIYHNLRNSFTNLEVRDANPTRCTFSAEEGFLSSELGACRFTTSKADSKLEIFAKHCKLFFDSVSESLELNVYTRVGLRTFFRKEFEDFRKAKELLTSLNPTNFEVSSKFGAEPSPREVSFRWEGKEIGGILRLSAETGTIDIELSTELQPTETSIHKKFNGLVLDFDYYTLSPVERSQWDPIVWIPNSVRMIKKELDPLLSR